MPKRLLSVLLSFLLVVPQCFSVYAEEDNSLNTENNEETTETADAVQEDEVTAETLPVEENTAEEDMVEESPVEEAVPEETSAAVPLTDLSFEKEVYYLRTSNYWYYSDYLQRTPSDSDSILTVSSGNEDVAAVDGQRIYGKSSGVAQITVTSDNGLSAVTELHVGSYATSINYKDYNYKLGINESVKLEYTLYPMDSSDEKVTFSVTSGSDYVSVSEDGTVTALAAGTARVRAETLRGSYTTFQITVYETPTKLTFKKDANYVRVNNTGNIWDYLNYEPSTAYGYPLEIISSNEDVISVTDTGIKAVSAGSANVTVKGGDVSASATFNVGNYASNISYKTYSYKLKINESVKLEYTLYPTDSSDEKVTFSVTSGSDYVSVSEDGTVTALAAGSARVRAETLGGSYTTYSITVYETPTKLTFRKDINYLRVNNTGNIWNYLNYEPASANGYPLEITSSNEDVISVTNDVIKAVSAGSATVTVKGGDVSASATFNVGNYATGINNSTYNYKLEVNGSVKLEYTLYPTDSSDEKVKFSVTSGSDYVSVSEDGTVTALAAGTARVRAETLGGSYTTYSITVYETPTKLTFRKDTNYLRVNDSDSVWYYLDYEPSNAYGYPLEITSSNEDVISVTNDVIKAVSAGSATVTVKGGEATASATFKVGNYSRRISYVTYNYYLGVNESVKLEYTLYPADSSDDKVAFSVTSGSDYVSVSEDGTVTALAAGTARVRAETISGNYTTFSITVYETPTELAFRKDTNYLRLNSSGNIWNYLTYKPSTANGYPLEITSSNEEVISVTDNVINAVSAGSATITVKGGNASASATFNVGNYASNIYYETYNYYLKINESVKLGYTLYPSESSDDKVTFSVTSGSDYVSVSEDGTVTALAAGTAYVKASILNGNSTGFSINVVSDPESLTFTNPTNYLDKYSGHDIWNYLSYQPSTAYKYPLTITSSDSDIVEILGTNLYGRSNGSATITVSDGIGHTVSASFVVGNYASTISTTYYDDIYVRNGSQLKLGYTLNPGNGDFSDEQVEWSVTSGTDFVSVSSDGTITALAGGNARVKATIRNGHSAQYYIDVYDVPVSLEFKNQNNYLDMISGKNIWSYLDYKPGTAYRCPLTITSSKPEVLEVSGNSLYGRSKGTATVTVTAENGVTATSTFTVGNYASSINRKGSSSQYMKPGESKKLEYTLYPANGDISDEAVEWTISSKTHDCISIDQDGNVTAKRPGYASVQAAIKNGAVISYTIRVVAAPDSLTFKNRTNYLDKFNSRYIWDYLTCEPETTNYYPLTIKSSNPDIIAVDGSNLIGKANGSATITVTAENGVTASSSFTVGNYASSIDSSMYSIYLTPGEETQLKYRLYPLDGDYSEELVKWNKTDDLIGCITLDQEGNVKAVKTGAVKVTAEIRNGRKTTFVVYVVPSPRRITFTRMDYYVGIGGNRYLTSDVIVDSVISQGIDLNLSSSNPAIPVNNNISISGTRKDTTIITAADNDGAFAKARYNIGYYANALTPKDGRYKTLFVGDSLQLEYEISGSGDYSDDKFTWTLRRSTNNCVRLSETGVVTALKTGTAEVAVESMTGAIAVFSIYVTDKPTAISFEKKEYEVSADRTIRLTAKVTPSSVVGDAALVWESSDPSVAAIDYNYGLYANIIGLREGTTTIRVSSAFDSSVYGECKLNVYEPGVPTAISIDPDITTYAGYSIEVPVELEPVKAGHYYTVKSSNSNIVCTPDMDKGTIRIDGKKAGTATITLTSEDNKVSASAKVTILEGTPECTGNVSIQHMILNSKNTNDYVHNPDEYVFVAGEVYLINTMAVFDPYMPDVMNNDFYTQLDSCGLFSDIRRYRSSVYTSEMQEMDYVRAGKAGTAELKTLAGKTLKIKVIDSAWLGTRVSADSSVPASFVNELKNSSLGIRYDAMFSAASLDGLENLSVAANEKAVVQSWLEVSVSNYQKNSKGNTSFVLTASAKAKVVSMASSADVTSDGTVLIAEQAAESVNDLSLEIPVSSIEGTAGYGDVSVKHQNASGEEFTYNGLYDDSVIYVKSPNGYGTFTVFAVPDGSAISVSIYGSSLGLDGKIGINFYLNIAEEDLNDLTVVMKMDEKEDIRVPASEGKASTVAGQKLRMFVYPVAAKEMRDKVTLTVENKSGGKVKLIKDDTDYTEGYPFSAADYFARAEEAGSEKTKKLARVLNNYGKYAQIYFKYHTDEVTDLTDVSHVTLETLAPYQAVQTENKVAGLTYVGGTTMLDDAIGYRLYFKIDTAHKISDYTFKMDGKVVTPVKSGSQYYIEKTDIAAKDLGVKNTVEVTDGENTFGIQYCALSYAYRALELTAEDKIPLQNMCRAMYLYNQQAIEYFNS